MTAAEIIFTVISLVLALVFIIFSVFIKYRKSEDEQLKLIFSKSLAQSFIVALIIHALELIFEYIPGNFYIISIGHVQAPLLLRSFIILGIIVFINKIKLEKQSKKINND